VSETLTCVRLKACLPRAGHVLRQYCFRGILFKAGAGWVKVSESIGEHLRGVRQQDRDAYSPLAFDVCSEDEARQLDARDVELNTESVPVDKAKVQLARDEIASGGSTTALAPGGPVSEINKDRPAARAKH